jgi:hypothetical protein
MSYLQPLTLFVVWHPAFTLGESIADEIYHRFCRNSLRPQVHGIGMPVFFRSHHAPMAPDGITPLPIERDAAQHIVVIVLLEPKIMLSPEWQTYLGKLAATIPPKGDFHTLLFVQVYDKPIKLPTQWNFRNLVMLELSKGETITAETPAYQQAVEQISLIIATECCRLLMTLGQPAEKKASLKLFLSHARRDGADKAKELHQHFNSVKNISTFLDVLAIDFGSDFREEIREGVRTAILLVWLTDAYSTREWCKREMLFAKEFGGPITVVNALSNQEARSFPYVGNTPTIRWQDNPQAVLSLAVFEALRHFYNANLMNAVKEGFKDHLSGLGEATHTLPHAPELLSFRFFPKGKPIKTILYPDPPLSQPELEAMDHMMGEMRMLTPTWMFAGKENMEGAKMLLKMKIAVSISTPDKMALNQRGYSAQHLNDTLVEFFRYIFAAGGTVLYGGDLRRDGYTKALIDLAGEYAKGALDPAPLRNYLSWPYSRLVDEDLRAELQGTVAFNLFHKKPQFEVVEDTPVDEFSPEQKFAAAVSILEMRKAMAENEDARILMGGKLQGYSGFFPGLLEEAWRTMKAKKPLYLMAAWGGCAGAIAEMLIDKTIPQAFKIDSRTDSQRELWRMLPDWEGKLDAFTDLPKGPEEMAQEILEMGLENLRNGLTEAENLQLFKAVHVPEMVGLVLKGLGNL